MNYIKQYNNIVFAQLIPSSSNVIECGFFFISNILLFANFLMKK